MDIKRPVAAGQGSDDANWHSRFGIDGGKLGTLFARAGHDVVFSYARSAQKLKRLAREARGNARAGTPNEAARNA
jgi:predicted dinucleotide-binding enzyme